MQAAIVAVGSELLGPDRIDSNSLGLSEILQRHGVPLRSKEVVADSIPDIASSLSRLAAEVEVVIVSGGLGPTSDDVTRDGIAMAFDMPLEHEASVLEAMTARFAKSGTRMPEVNRRQALVPEGAQCIPNERGTAPGLRVETESCTLFFFPGVPRELVGMVESHLEPWLQERSCDAGIERRTLRVACLPESRVEELIAPAYDEMGRESITILARPGEIEIRVFAAGAAAERKRKLEGMLTRMKDLVGDAGYSDREDDHLETVVGRLLRERGATVSTAESCTGGLISQRLTAVAGSSAYFVGGVVAYSNGAKANSLAVAESLIQRHGAVSREVAAAMARGAVDRFHTDYGLSVTGIAGPEAGSDTKPVGTVHIALAHGGGGSREHHATFPGDRGRVRQLTSQWALDLLRRDLLGFEELSRA